jgi:hypothetical protein
VSEQAPPRRFLGPFIGIAAVFAGLGPPIGGVTFVPLALALKASAAGGALAFATLVSALFGHWIMLIAAYVVGFGPAVATGVLYALWDAAAPGRWPRALVGAVIGGFVTYAVATRLAALGVSLDTMFDSNFDAPAMQSISMAEPVATRLASTGAGLVRAFAASGAVAGMACAMAASLIGLTMQPRPVPPGAVGTLR